jgi:Spy/CpxP family protein refolding chaperone
MEKTMRPATILLLAATACLYACSTAAPKSSAAPPPFECTSIHPEVCELEEQFHKLRHEQAEQISAIEEAEQRRKEQDRATASAAARPGSTDGLLLDAPAG